MVVRPTDEQIQWNPDEANVEVQDSGKQNLGFVFKEKFGSKVANWLFKRFSTWLNWTIDKIDAHETTEDMTFTDLEEAMDYLKNLKHNDYTITINMTGFSNDAYELELYNITGKGEILINADSGSIVVGTASFKNIANAINITVLATQRFTTSKKNGLIIDNCSNVSINRLLSEQDGASSINDRFIKVINHSSLKITSNALLDAQDLDVGEHMVFIDETSFFYLNSATITPPDTEASVDRRSVINCQGIFTFNEHPTFAGHWYRHYGAQLQGTVIPRSSEPWKLFYGNSSIGANFVLNRIRRLDGDLDLEGNMGTNETNIRCENLCGEGVIRVKFIISASDDITRRSRFINVQPEIIFEQDVLSVKSHATNTPIILKNCAKIRLGDVYLRTTSGESGYCMIIDNCRGFINSLRVASGSNDSTEPRYCIIDNNSNININNLNTSILSASGAQFHFIRIAESKVAITDTTTHGGTDTIRVSFDGFAPSHLIAIYDGELDYSSTYSGTTDLN